MQNQAERFRLSLALILCGKKGLDFMKFTNAQEVKDFLDAVNKCREDVWLTSPTGDRYNLKSELSQYIAIGALLQNKGHLLELFCASKADEGHFYQFFQEHPGVNAIGR